VQPSFEARKKGRAPQDDGVLVAIAALFLPERKSPESLSSPFAKNIPLSF
jgi:hypothetical protein